MEQKKKISIALSPEVLKQLEDGNYNKSKLIDSLLSQHFTLNKVAIKKLKYLAQKIKDDENCE